MYVDRRKAPEPAYPQRATTVGYPQVGQILRASGGRAGPCSDHAPGDVCPTARERLDPLRGPRSPGTRIAAPVGARVVRRGRLYCRRAVRRSRGWATGMPDRVARPRRMGAADHPSPHHHPALGGPERDGGSSRVAARRRLVSRRDDVQRGRVPSAGSAASRRGDRAHRARVGVQPALGLDLNGHQPHRRVSVGPGSTAGPVRPSVGVGDRDPGAPLPRLAGYKVRPQVVIPGVGRVDLLVGESLIIECDSHAHHTGETNYRGDRRRDLSATADDYRVVRLTWEQCFLTWPTTTSCLLYTSDAADE